MIKVHNIHIGAKSDLYQLNDDWAFVHACKTSHKERLGYTKPPKNEPYYMKSLNSIVERIKWYTYYGFETSLQLAFMFLAIFSYGLISATSPSFTSCQSFGAEFSRIFRRFV